MSTNVSGRLFVLAIAMLPVVALAASSDYHAQITSSAPVLWYQFNEPTGAAVNYGSLGAGYNATYNGSPTRAAPTELGDAGVAFAAGSDYLESLGTSPANLTGNPSFSAEALFFIPTSGACGLWAPFLHWGPSPAGSPTAKSVYFSFSQNDATAAFAGFYNGGPKSPTGALPKGRWHHFVWVRDAGVNNNALTGTTVYLDGKDVTADLVPDPALPVDNLVPIVEAGVFRVNRAQDFDEQRFFIGTLDEVALYDRKLTGQEVLDHFRVAVNGIFKDQFE